MKAFAKRVSRRVAHELERLRSDESGSLMILFIAAVLLLVAMIWAIIGTGQRVVQKELIQSSADAATFSAAVIKAKGLNVIAFCNLIMALLLAIIMLLRLIKVALQVAIFFVTAACFASVVDFGATSVFCGLDVPLTTALNEYNQILQQVEPRIMDAMRGMAKVERGVAKVFPALSLVEALRVGTHAHYQHNFSGGTLVTVTFPLPVGDDLSLPVKDGTWDDLCNNAASTVGRLVAAVIDATGLPSILGSVLGGAVTDSLGAMKLVLCDDDASASNVKISGNTTKHTCSECDGSNTQSSNWTGNKIVTDSSGNILSSTPGGTCQLAGFNSAYCTDPDLAVQCADGNTYNNLQLTACLVKQDVTASLGSPISNKPLPLMLTDDSAKRLIIRGYTLLTSSNMDARRRAVAVGIKNTANPALNQLFASAEAQVYQHNGAQDLWHMDWRARLIRFSFTNETNGSVDSSSGGPNQSEIDKIFGALENFITNDVGSALADQFLLH